MATKPAPGLKPNYKAEQRKSRADRLAPGLPDAENDPNASEDNSLEARYAGICDTVNNNIRDAITARETSGIEDIWAEDEDQYNGVDESTSPYNNVKTREQVPQGTGSGAIRDGRAHVFVPITKPKTDTGVARVTEMLVPTDDQPWKIEPTPDPEIDKAIDDRDATMVYSADGSLAMAAHDAAIAIKHGAGLIAQAEQDWIETRLQAGHVYAEIRQVIRDAGRIGTGVLKGPIPISREMKRWKVKPGSIAQGKQPQKILPGSVDPNEPPPPPPQPPQNAATGANAQQGGVQPPAAPASVPDNVPQQPTPQTPESPQSQPGKTVSIAPPASGAQTGAQAPSVPPAQLSYPPLPAITTSLERFTVVEPTSVCVRAQDCFPDPSCGDSIHNGAFFAERTYMTPKKLRDLALLPGYDAQAIVDALKEGPRPFGVARDPTFRPVAGDTSYDAKLYEVYDYFGEASPDDLRLLMERGNPHPDDMQADDATPSEEDDGPSPLDGVLSKEDQLYLKAVPVQVTMVNGKPIRAVLNPMETGAFPYDMFPWEPVKGQPWGRGIPRKMGVAQRIVNAAVRSMLENAGLSAGPQLVTMAGAITPWDGNYEVRGRKGWHFKPGESGVDDVRKAFMIESIPSTQEESMAIINFGFELADQLTNMPMLIQGDQQAGTSPETLGGMKLLMQNAMSPLRVIAKLADDKLFEPHISRWHDWAMEKGPANIKGGDTRVKARGSTALIQREEGREFLMQVFPVKDDPTLRIDPVKFIREMAKSNGFDMTTVQYTDDEWKIVQQKTAANQPQDPRVQAAQIAASATIQAQQLKSQDVNAQSQGNVAASHEDNQTALQLKNLELQIAQMKSDTEAHRTQTAGAQHLVDTKVKLVTAAMQNRQRAEEMNRKPVGQTSDMGA